MNFLFWNTFSFSGCHIFLFLRFSSQDCLLLVVSSLQGLFPPSPLSCSYSCILHATYFGQSYDNKLNQRFSGTTHSFSLPTKSLLSLTLRWKRHTVIHVSHFSSACEPYLHKHCRDILSHFVKLVSGQLCCAYEIFGTAWVKFNHAKENRNGSACTSSSLYYTGCAALLLLLRQCGIIHLSNDLREQLVHHSLALGRSFNKRAAPLLSQSSSVWPSDLTLRFQVNFVPDQDQWHLLEALHSHYLVSHWSDVLEERIRVWANEKHKPSVAPGKMISTPL